MSRRKENREIVVKELENDEEEDLLREVSGLPNPLSRTVTVTKKHLYDFLGRSIGLYFLQAVLVTAFTLLLQPVEEIYYFIYGKAYSWVAAIVILFIMGFTLLQAAIYTKFPLWVKKFSAINFIVFTLCYMYCCGWVSFNYFELFCIFMGYLILGSFLIGTIILFFNAFSRWGATLLCGISLLIVTPIVILIYQETGWELGVAIGVGIVWGLCFPMYISRFLIQDKALVVHSEYFVASMQLHFCWLMLVGIVAEIWRTVTKKEEKEQEQDI